MRRMLVDRARACTAAKRGGQLQRVDHSTAVELDEIPDVSAGRDREIIALDEALEAQAKIDARKAKVIELRFFGGLSVEETAAVVKQSVMRDWSLAKAWLVRELSKEKARGPGAMAED
jgi:hypothetical protein